MSLHSLPLFVRMAGEPVILIGEGHMADAKRRLLERAGARIVGGDDEARFAFVTLGGEAGAETVAKLKARGVLVNASDRPELCDFTMPAIVERGPVIVAVGTGGASAGLSAALRQRIEALLPAGLGRLAEALHAARERMRAAFPDFDERRRAIGGALAPGGTLDPLAPGAEEAIDRLIAGGAPPPRIETIRLTSADPDDLTLRAARALSIADRVYHAPGAPPAILERARGDAERIAGPAPAAALSGTSVVLEGPE